MKTNLVYDSGVATEDRLSVERDSAGNEYLDVQNLRLTFVRAQNRREKANWSGRDVIRIQAYQDDKSNKLHQGGEFPVGGEAEFLDLIETLIRLRRVALSKPTK